MASLFGHVEPAPKDPIIGVTEAFLGDPSLDKVNVGVPPRPDARAAGTLCDFCRPAPPREAAVRPAAAASPARHLVSCWWSTPERIGGWEHCSNQLAAGGRSSPQLVALCLVPMSKKKNKSEKSVKLLKDAEQAVTSDYITGDCLDDLLSKLIRSVEVAKASRGGLPEKIWMKQQFSVGVNDVTRVLERMPAAAASRSGCSSKAPTSTVRRRAPLVPLQAVIIAADCNPKWLTKHIPTLASTRQVPVLCLKDNKGSSLRLGQVANVRTALAIGIKARDSIINKAIDEILKDYKPGDDEQ
ncbi:hypothetical protein ZWY2020_039293 [Hordeum vulgare]|nr:hypothetical protein ZWY2020_039293 [Hordeum vulgare]